MVAGKCHALTREGRPCSASARPGRQHCLWHDPAADAERRELSRKGGQSRSSLARLKRGMPAEPLTIPDVQGILGAVLRDLLAGDVDPPVANSAAAVARAFAALATAGEMEERIRSLEERLALRAAS